MVDPQPRRDSRSVALDEHVGALHEIDELGTRGDVSEVEPDDWLAAVQHRVARHVAAPVAVGRFPKDVPAVIGAHRRHRAATPRVRSSTRRPSKMPVTCSATVVAEPVPDRPAFIMTLAR